MDEKNSLEKVNRRSTKYTIPREQYLSRYGPTVGDRVNINLSIKYHFSIIHKRRSYWVIQI